MAIGGMYQVKNPAVKALNTQTLTSDEEDEKKKKERDALKARTMKAGVIGGAALAGLSWAVG